MKRTKAEKALDKQIEAIFYANCFGVQLNILDIQDVFDAGRRAAAAGTDISAAVLAAVAELRVN